MLRLREHETFRGHTFIHFRIDTVFDPFAFDPTTLAKEGNRSFLVDPARALRRLDDFERVEALEVARACRCGPRKIPW
jgi:hypothetical protein